jgi:hypothetical protein
MSKLLETWDERLYHVIVNGDIIINSSRIVTRSRASTTPDEYTKIPFPAKALKLLLNELCQNMEKGDVSRSVGMNTNTSSLANTGSDESFEEEWEDDAGIDLDVLDNMDGGELEDEEIKNDVLYALDMKGHLGRLLGVISKRPGFDHLMTYLNEQERGVLYS